jgi:hypothetical protein
MFGNLLHILHICLTYLESAEHLNEHMQHLGNVVQEKVCQRIPLVRYAAYGWQPNTTNEDRLNIFSKGDWNYQCDSIANCEAPGTDLSVPKDGGRASLCGKCNTAGMKEVEKTRVQGPTRHRRVHGSNTTWTATVGMKRDQHFFFKP